MSESELFIRKGDFNSIELVASMYNKTSHAEVVETPEQKKLKKSKGIPKDALEIIVNEIQSSGFIFRVPAKSCSDGHSLDIQIRVLNASRKVDFKASVRVTESELLDDEWQRINVELIRFDEAVWEDLKSVYGERQEEIFRLLKDMKGY